MSLRIVFKLSFPFWVGLQLSFRVGVRLRLIDRRAFVAGSCIVESSFDGVVSGGWGRGIRKLFPLHLNTHGALLLFPFLFLRYPTSESHESVKCVTTFQLQAIHLLNEGIKASRQGLTTLLILSTSHKARIEMKEAMTRY